MLSNIYLLDSDSERGHPTRIKKAVKKYRHSDAMLGYHDNVHFFNYIDKKFESQGRIAMILLSLFVSISGCILVLIDRAGNLGRFLNSQALLPKLLLMFGMI